MTRYRERPSAGTKVTQHWVKFCAPVKPIEILSKKIVAH